MSTSFKKLLITVGTIASLATLSACGKPPMTNNVVPAGQDPHAQAKAQLYKDIGLDQKGTVKKPANMKPLPPVIPAPPAPAKDNGEFPIK